MKDWHQIVIEDGSGLSGQSLADLIGIMAQNLPPSLVVVSRVEGAGDIGGLFPEMAKLGVEDLRTRAVLVQQFDWGDFFFIEDQEALVEVSSGSSFLEILPLTVATVRVVDDTYFYIYTRDVSAAGALDRSYPGAVHTVRSIETLEFPE